jgi:hypothetical protein
MIIRLHLKYILAFFALIFVLHEGHELAHTITGRLICGCWGQRDFNVWSTCETCKSSWTILAGIAGPLFTFAVLWLGAWLMQKKRTSEQKMLGFSLVFATMPFGRFFNPVFGGGDEVQALDAWMNNWDQSRIGALILVVLICLYPVIKAFRLIRNKRKIWIFLGFLLLPFAIDLLVVLGLLNTLLEKGLLSMYWVLGSPALVTAWTLFVTLLFFLMRKQLYTLSAADTPDLQE